jgi:hypothetical protein
MYWTNRSIDRQLSPFVVSMIILCTVCIFMNFFVDEFGYIPEAVTKNSETANMDDRDVFDHGNDQFVQCALVECPDADRTSPAMNVKFLFIHRMTVTPIFSPPRI